MVKVIDDKLNINGIALESYTVQKELGEGANGIVYLVHNSMTGRNEALKIWVKNRPQDSRDKLKQGLLEAQKQAANINEHTVQIYHVDQVNDSIYATMEYIDGVSLKEFYKSTDDKHLLVNIAYKYLEIIEQITSDKATHGDPHWGNILVMKKPQYRQYEPPEFLLKICDFGTSHFSNKESSKQRHWRIVKETVLNLTKKFDSKDFAMDVFETFKDLDTEICNSSVLTDFEKNQCRTAILKDYLDGLSIEVDKYLPKPGTGKHSL